MFPILRRPRMNIMSVILGLRNRMKDMMSRGHTERETVTDRKRDKRAAEQRETRASTALMMRRIRKALQTG